MDLENVLTDRPRGCQMGAAHGQHRLDRRAEPGHVHDNLAVLAPEHIEHDIGSLSGVDHIQRGTLDITKRRGQLTTAT